MKDSKPVSLGERIRKLDAGQFITVEKIGDGSGSLQARKLSSGHVKLYWRYTHEGAKLRDEIGMWDSSAPPLSGDPTDKGYSFRAAVAVCVARAKTHRDEKADGGWPGHKERAQAQRDAAESHAVLMSEQTLSKLLDTYCAHLENRGRRSHADARSIFKVHVKAAWPALANAPAANLSSEQVADMLRPVREAGKGRTANKLRSYLHAAFRCAVDAKYDDDLPETFKLFQVVANPVTQIRRKPEADRPDKNPLKLAQLRQYWKALAAVDGIKGSALRLHLLTGGQRVEQFAKLLKADVLPDRIVLIDPKGRRTEPLRHSVALTPAAQKEVRKLQALAAEARTNKTPAQEVPTAKAPAAGKGKGRTRIEAPPDPFPYLLSTDGGATHLNAMTLTRWAQAAAKDIPDFQLKQVRSGVETALAGAKVSLDLRGLLQSHGLSSLQRRHYDDHDYTPELKVVLLTLGRLLTGRERSKTGRN